MTAPTSLIQTSTTKLLYQYNSLLFNQCRSSQLLYISRSLIKPTRLSPTQTPSSKALMSNLSYYEIILLFLENSTILQHQDPGASIKINHKRIINIFCL